jgi:hypothetical protein
VATYQFDVEHAARWGVNEAIFLHNLLFWLRKNKAEGRHHHDGRTWTFSTTAALAQLYPFWKPHQVRYVIDSLKRQEVILTGHYGADRFDRTLWFAVADEGLLELHDLPPTGNSVTNNPEARFAKFRKSRREKSHIEAPKSATPNKESDVQPDTDTQPKRQTLNVGAASKSSKPMPERVDSVTWTRTRYGLAVVDHTTDAVVRDFPVTGDCSDHGKTAAGPRRCARQSGPSNAARSSLRSGGLLLRRRRAPVGAQRA